MVRRVTRSVLSGTHGAHHGALGHQIVHTLVCGTHSFVVLRVTDAIHMLVSSYATAGETLSETEAKRFAQVRVCLCCARRTVFPSHAHSLPTSP